MRVSSLQADGFGRFGERLYFCGTQLLRPSKMRQCVLVWLASLFLLAGCRQGVGDSPGLVELDSLIAAAPDSAAARLAAWPADSLRTAADRAYHALLLTQARYKAYIPATTDSLINLAVAHYASSGKGDYDRRIRSLIYKGCVMTELDQPDSAMYWLMQAENIAQPDDHINLGYINFRMGELYLCQISASENALAKYRAALSHYSMSGDSSRMLLCLMELGGLYRELDADSACKYIDETKVLAQKLGDETVYYSAMAMQAYSAYLAGNFQAAKDSALTALKSGVRLTDSVGTMMFAAMSMAKLGQTDSAKSLSRQIRMPDDSATQVLYYDMCAQLCQAQGDQVGYLQNMRQCESVAGDLLSRSLQQQLSDIEQKSHVQRAIAESNSARQKALFVVAVSLMLLLLALTSLAYWRKKQMLNAELQKNQIGQLLFKLESLSHTNQELAKEIQSSGDNISSLRTQLEKQQQVIDKKDRIISALTDESTRLKDEHLKRQRLSKSLEYVAGMLHNFISQSHELKPSEFLDKFRSGFLETPNGGEADFWYMLRTEADQVHGGAVEKMFAEHPQLNEKERHIICMMALGFSTEMMATCLQHKSNYIETLKNRLKKKLDIQCPIVEYIKQFGNS